jgi:hypothetical protein
MDYFGPSRVHARSSNNPWSALTAEEHKKIALSNPDCKRVVKCLENIAPMLEAAAHRILVEDWKKGLWRKAQYGVTFILLLLFIGGYALAYQVITAGSYTKATEQIYNTLSGKGPDKPFPATAAATAFVPSDPGAPSWAPTTA